VKVGERLAFNLAAELDDIVERLEELAEYAGEELKIKGTQHKIEEAVGGLKSAASAAYQSAGITD
jgi:hypothetical protein